MNETTPTLDQVEELAAQYPGRFTDIRQTLNSLRNARNAPSGAQNTTAQAHYNDYLKNGGTPIGSNGAMPPRTDTLDQQFGSANCDCGAATPCCLEALTFTCSHGSERMKLPLAEGDTKDRVLAVLTDKSGTPGYHDHVTITPKLRATKAQCRMPEKTPVMRIKGIYTGDAKINVPLSWDVPYHTTTHLGTTAFARFASALKYSLFDDITGLAKHLELEVLSCARRSELNSLLHVYPRLEWKADAFSFEVKGTFLSNFTFLPSVSAMGELSGSFQNDTFKVGVELATDEKPLEHSKSMIPFLDPVLKRMQALTGQTKGVKSGAETRSKIVVTHKFELANATFKLVEHATDRTQIGIDAEVNIGYAPLLEVKCEIDVIDLVLTAAQAVPAAAGLAKALQKAREVAATGYGTKETAVQASGHVAVKLAADGSVGGGVSIKRKPSDTAWQGSGKVEGKIGFTLAGVARAEGRIYVIEGSFAAESSAVTDITATLSTLTPSERASAKGAKFNTKIEWGGIKVKYKAIGKAGWSIGSGSFDRAGELIVQEKATWYESTY